MSCRLHEPNVVDIARGERLDPSTTAATDAHLRSCSRCRARLARERMLSAELRAFAEATADAQPSSRVEARLLPTFEQPGRDTTAIAQARRPWWPWIGAAAAITLVVASLAILELRTGDSRHPRVGSSAAELEFVAWPGAESLPALESGQLVRLDLPASILPLLGFEASQATDTVAADVIIGQDGFARAVRLAEASGNSRTRN